MIYSRNKLYLYNLFLLIILVIFIDNPFLKVTTVCILFGIFVYDVIYNYNPIHDDFELMLKKIKNTMYVSHFQYDKVIKLINLFRELYEKLKFNDVNDCKYQFSVLSGLSKDIMYNYFSIILKSERNDRIVENINILGKELFEFLENKLKHISEKCGIDVYKIEGIDLKKLKKNNLIYDYNYIT